MIPSLLTAREMSLFEFKNCVVSTSELHSGPAEVHSGPSQASQMDLFARKVNVFKLKLLIQKVLHSYMASIVITIT